MHYPFPVHRVFFYTIIKENKEKLIKAGKQDVPNHIKAEMRLMVSPGLKIQFQAEISPPLNKRPFVILYRVPG
jgi:hypothetical protein